MQMTVFPYTHIQLRSNRFCCTQPQKKPCTQTDKIQIQSVTKSNGVYYFKKKEKEVQLHWSGDEIIQWNWRIINEVNYGMKHSIHTFIQSKSAVAETCVHYPINFTFWFWNFFLSCCLKSCVFACAHTDVSDISHREQCQISSHDSTLRFCHPFVFHNTRRPHAHAYYRCAHTSRLVHNLMRFGFYCCRDYFRYFPIV